MDGKNFRDPSEVREGPDSAMLAPKLTSVFGLGEVKCIKEPTHCYGP